MWELDGQLVVYTMLLNGLELRRFLSLLFILVRPEGPPCVSDFRVDRYAESNGLPFACQCGAMHWAQNARLPPLLIMAPAQTDLAGVLFGKRGLGSHLSSSSGR